MFPFLNLHKSSHLRYVFLLLLSSQQKQYKLFALHLFCKLLNFPLCCQPRSHQESMLLLLLRNHRMLFPHLLLQMYVSVCRLLNVDIHHLSHPQSHNSVFCLLIPVLPLLSSQQKQYKLFALHLFCKLLNFPLCCQPRSHQESMLLLLLRNHRMLFPHLLLQMYVSVCRLLNVDIHHLSHPQSRNSVFCLLIPVLLQ